MPELNGRNLVVGILVNGVIIYLLERYDEKAALVYALLLFMIVFFAYRNQILGALNASLNYIKGGNNG